MNFDELMTNLVGEDAELKRKLRNKIAEGIDKLDLAGAIQKSLGESIQDIEWIEILGDDVEAYVKKILAKSLKAQA